MHKLLRGVLLMVKLIIDPGHGGKDPGGGTNKDFKEKDMVLKISKYQLNRFKDLGVDVSLTRTNDKYIDSTPRANIVKNSGADYCISNHVNAGGGNGAETIYSIHSDGKLAIAILNELKAVGQKIRRAFTKRGKSGDYYFMHRQTGSVETVIVEYGFADTQEDSDRIIKNWKIYAEAVIKAFCNHVGVKYVVPGKGVVKPPKVDAKPSKTNTAPSKSKANLTVDGKWGKSTTRALQAYLGTPVDGIISKQSRNAVSQSLYGNTVQFGAGGSVVIRSLQKLIGVKVDGLLGPATVRALQKYLLTTVDGKLSRPSLVVKALQRALNAGVL